MTTMIDMRCPVVHQRLFARLSIPLADATIVEGNLIEIACQDCRRGLRKMGQPCSLVLHRFNLLGVCVETEVVP